MIAVCICLTAILGAIIAHAVVMHSDMTEIVRLLHAISDAASGARTDRLLDNRPQGQRSEDAA